MKKESYNFNSFLSFLKKKFFPFYKDKEIKKIFRTLEKNEVPKKDIAMFVGGCVRKYLSGSRIDDIDIACILTPQKIKEKFEGSNFKIIDTGIKHGTITLLGKKKYEITTLRKDIKTDGRHAVIEYTDDWKEDSNRRDFTFNAIYLKKNGEIFDPQSGVLDLKNKIVKFIGDPSKRIEEDFLRIIRFLRFSLYYDSQIDSQTIKIIKLHLDGIKNLSKERILLELDKILELENFIKILKNKDLKEIFALIFPELKYLDRLEKIKKIDDQISIDKDIILSTILIDQSSNHEYFCHKYKTSNLMKNKLNLIAKYFFTACEDKSFFEQNIKANTYFLGKNFLINLIIILYFSNKIKYQVVLKKIDEIKRLKIPKFNYDGKYLLKKGFKEGKNLGIILEKLEKKWANNNFILVDSEIEKITRQFKN